MARLRTARRADAEASRPCTSAVSGHPAASRTSPPGGATAGGTRSVTPWHRLTSVRSSGTACAINTDGHGVSLPVSAHLSWCSSSMRWLMSDTCSRSASSWPFNSNSNSVMPAPDASDSTVGGEPA